MNRLITDCPEVLFAFVWTFFFCVSFVFYCITKEIKDSRNISSFGSEMPMSIRRKANTRNRPTPAATDKIRVRFGMEGT